MYISYSRYLRYWILFFVVLTLQVSADSTKLDDVLLKQRFAKIYPRFEIFSLDKEEELPIVTNVYERWFKQRDPLYRIEALFINYSISANSFFVDPESSIRFFNLLHSETTGSEILGDQLFAMVSEFHLFLLRNSEPSNISRKREFIKNIKSRYGENTEKLIYLWAALEYSNSHLVRFFKGLEAKDIKILIDTKVPNVFFDDQSNLEDLLLFYYEFIEIINGQSDSIVQTIHAKKIFEIADTLWVANHNLKETLALLKSAIEKHENSENWMVEYHRTRGLTHYAVLVCANAVERRHTDNLIKYIKNTTIFESDDQKKFFQDVVTNNGCPKSKKHPIN